MNSSDCAPERVVMLRRMREASNVFYGLAVQSGCHPFIEFTGLMNEYIKCCEAAHKTGVDFARCNKHAGQHLPMQPFQVDYVNEKLECIFTGRSVMGEQQQQAADALRKDADRYRWLRANTRASRSSILGRQVFQMPTPSPAGHNLIRGSVAQHLDECIDGAMKTDAELTAAAVGAA